jgi:hypothetical protein
MQRPGAGATQPALPFAPPGLQGPAAAGGAGATQPALPFAPPGLQGPAAAGGAGATQPALPFAPPGLQGPAAAGGAGAAQGLEPQQRGSLLLVPGFATPAPPFAPGQPEAPKRPLTDWLMWKSDQLRLARAEREGERDEVLLAAAAASGDVGRCFLPPELRRRGADSQEVMKEFSRLWGTLPRDVYPLYSREYKARKEQYDANLAAWEARHGKRPTAATKKGNKRKVEETNE